MDKKLGILALFLLIFSMISLSLIGSALAANNKPIKMIYATFDPPMGPWAEAMKEWKKDIETKTNGRLQVNISWAGSLGKAENLFNAVRKGLADAVNLQPGLVPGLFPMSDYISLPWVIDDATMGGKALIEFYKLGYLDNEYKDVKVQILYTGTGDPIFTKKTPVTTLKDVSGLKLFAPGPASQNRVKLMGGVPTMLSSPMDLNPALQKNIIDGLVQPFPIVNMLMLFRHLNYVTEPGVGTIPVSIVMNKDFYNKLPKDMQKIFADVSYDHSMNFASKFDAFFHKSRKSFEKKGGKILQWTPEAMIELEKIYASIWQNWIKEKEAKGLPAKKAIDDFYAILEDLGAKDPAIGYKPGK